MDTKAKQLYEGNSLDNPFFPKTIIDNIFDKDTEENLYTYLSKFNHINAGYVSSAIDARNYISEIFRKPGFYITYYLNNKCTTEFFIGSKESAIDNEEWIKDENWQLYDGVGEIEFNSIKLNQLSKEIIDLLSKGNNIITNYPDGEDIIQEDICGGNGKNEINVLKFANKEFNSSNFSGYGRIWLRKNIININTSEIPEYINILTQDMINKPNTIYIIQYDYDLNGDTITIEHDTILLFFGGSIKNGNVIIKENVEILPQGCNIENYIKCPIEGNFKEGQILYDSNIKNIKIWNGENWINSNGISIDIKTIGTTEQRPVINIEGFEYYDTTLKKKILWNGTNWVNIDGTTLE